MAWALLGLLALASCEITRELAQLQGAVGESESESGEGTSDTTTDNESETGTMDGCMLDGTETTCEVCVQLTCCAELEACMDQPQCLCTIGCLAADDVVACAMQCQSAPETLALLQCLKNCAPVCL